MLRRDPLAHPEALIPRIYAYAAYRVGDGPDADDVTSETFARALRYRDSYDGAKGEPIAWLLGIARRCADQTLSARLLTTALERDVAAPGQLEAASIRRLDVRAAVSALDDRDRELIALHYGADLTAREIGELLGAKTNAVEVALHRVLERLRARLGEEVLERPAAAASRL